VLPLFVDASIGARRRIAATVAGGLAAVLIFILVWIVHRLIQRRGNEHRLSATGMVFSAFLILGVILPPAAGAGIDPIRCSTGLLSDFENEGRALSEAIPPDSLVYWKGSGRHIALLLYAEDMRFFPPQINAGGGYYHSGERDHMLRIGIFDDAIDAGWREAADVFILWEGYPNVALADFENSPEYERIPYEMGYLAGCEEPLYLYRREQ
jgi:hypothetical protein